MSLKRLLLALLGSAFFTFASFAQSFFQKSYHHSFVEETSAVERLTDGDYVLAGFVVPDASGRKAIWVMRVSAQGETVWSNTYSLAQSCSATALQKTSDGNLLLTYNAVGSSASTLTSGWLKISTNGAVIWSKKAIGNSSLTNISQVSGGYLLSGQSITASQMTGLVVRIGEDGAIIWSSVFGENGQSTVNDCWEDGLGFFHCCGVTSETGGNQNGFWAKLSAAGELVGPVRRYGTSQADELVRIVPMGTDRLLMSGYSKGFSNNIYSSVWVLETDYFGVVKSSKIYSLTENDLVTNDLIALPGDQYLLALGNLSGQLSPAILIKLSIDLDQLFAYQYKGGSESDVFSQVIKTSNGLAAMGVTYQNGDANAYLVATDGEGKLNNEDCCPKPLDITVQVVMPETATFVPTQTAFYAVQNVTFTVTDLALATKNLCQPIDLDFSVSVDTICPGECVDITEMDSTMGVIYTFEYVGGVINPDHVGQVCHTEGSALFITRKGRNSNCEQALTKRINVGAKMDRFPNAFTPNGDGSNDIFRPVFGCPALSMHFQVFNRWGIKVFDGTDPLGGWDGKVDGNNAPSDVYVWILEYEVEINGSIMMFPEKGEVTLLR